MASHNNSDVHSRAAAALRGLISSVPVDDDDTACMSFRRGIVQEGGLEPISRLLLSKDIHVLRDALLLYMYATRTIVFEDCAIEPS